MHAAADERRADFQVFDQLDQLIVSVALVTPKPGLFNSDIQHLLVVATPVEITLLGLAPGPARGTLHIYPVRLARRPPPRRSVGGVPPLTGLAEAADSAYIHRSLTDAAHGDV